MSTLVRRILGGHGDPDVISESPLTGRDAALVPGSRGFVRDFILSGLGRSEIELRYEQVFAHKLGLKTAQCRSATNGPLTKLEIQFDLPEGSRMQLSRLYFILRDVAQSFDRRLVPKSALMELTACVATLTFMLEP
jgi:hypothetical protein